MRRGEPWGAPSTGPPDVTVMGDDASLAATVRAHPGTRIRFDPSSASDVARGLGIGDGAGTRTTEVPLDAIDLDGVDGRDGQVAVNAVVLGPGPDRLRWRHRRRPTRVEVDGRVLYEGRATTVVLATGQFLRGSDLVPRGHPGDGRLEVQVYALAPSHRHAMRVRLPLGTHVPHPEIVEGSGRRVVVEAASPWPLEVDGRPAGRRAGTTATIRPGACRLLV